MLLIDKYRQNDLSQLDFHQNVNFLLTKMIQSSSIPHMILYGPEGVGKQTRLRLFLKALYGEEVLKLKNEVISLDSKTEFTVLNSSYHTEIHVSNLMSRDRQCVQELVKQLSSLKSASSFLTKKKLSTIDFRFFVIHEAHLLSLQAQASLRRTMEKNSNTSRFILTTNSINNLIEPIRSRCFCIHLPRIAKSECANYLRNIAFKEKMSISDQTIDNIVDNAECDVSTCLVLLEQSNRANKFKKLSWHILINQIVNKMLGPTSLMNLYEIKNLIYQLYVKGVDAQLILKKISFELIDYLVSRKKFNNILEICEVSNHYSIVITKSNKPLNAVIASVIYIQYAMMRVT